MWKKIILLIIFYLLVCRVIYENNPTIESLEVKTSLLDKISTPPTKELPIGNLKITKINLNEELYSKESTHNNIEEHITILPPSKEPFEKNSTIFIAAHSGTGKLAYFKRLDELTQGDIITLTYNKIKYIYVVKEIYEFKKTGTISVPKQNTNQLVLTTCHPTKKDYQLVINCHIKRA